MNALLESAAADQTVLVIVLESVLFLLSLLVLLVLVGPLLLRNKPKRNETGPRLRPAEEWNAIYNYLTTQGTIQRLPSELQKLMKRHGANFSVDEESLDIYWLNKLWPPLCQARGIAEQMAIDFLRDHDMSFDRFYAQVKQHTCVTRSISYAAFQHITTVPNTNVIEPSATVTSGEEEQRPAVVEDQPGALAEVSQSQDQQQEVVVAMQPSVPTCMEMESAILVMNDGGDIPLLDIGIKDPKLKGRHLVNHHQASPTDDPVTLTEGQHAGDLDLERGIVAIKVENEEPFGNESCSAKPNMMLTYLHGEPPNIEEPQSNAATSETVSSENNPAGSPEKRWPTQGATEDITKRVNVLRERDKTSHFNVKDTFSLFHPADLTEQEASFLPSYNDTQQVLEDEGLDRETLDIITTDICQQGQKGRSKVDQSVKRARSSELLNEDGGSASKYQRTQDFT